MHWETRLKKAIDRCEKGVPYWTAVYGIPSFLVKNERKVVYNIRGGRVYVVRIRNNSRSRAVFKAENLIYKSYRSKSKEEGKQ